MSQKDCDRFGRLGVASLQFINEVRQRDREGKRRQDPVRLYKDTHSPKDLPLASELLAEIDIDDLDPIQSLLIEGLRTETSLVTNKSDEEIAQAVTTHEALSKYKTTPKYRQKVIALQDMRLEGHSPEESRSDFVGTIFADIAEVFYKPTIEQGILLSDSATSNFFKRYYRDKTPIQHPFGHQAIQGISVPDAMVIGVRDSKPTILKFVEYTLSHSDEKYLSQLRGYGKSATEIQYKSPGTIDSDFCVDFVVPKRPLGGDYPRLESESVVGNYHYLEAIESMSFGHEIDLILGKQNRSNYQQKTHFKS